MVLLVTVRQLPVIEWATVLTSTLREHGIWGALGFGLAFAFLSSVFVPGSLLSMLAGATWGLWGGTAIVVPAAALATMGSAWVGRTMLREFTADLLARQRLLAALDRAFGKRAFRMVALLRLSPIMPFAPSNYALGATSASLAALGGGTLVGLIPITLFWVHVGTLAQRAILDPGGPASTTRTWLLGGGLLVTLVVLMWLSRLAKRELDLEGGPNAVEDEEAPGLREGAD